MRAVWNTKEKKHKKQLRPSQAIKQHYAEPAPREQEQERREQGGRMQSS